MDHWASLASLMGALALAHSLLHAFLPPALRRVLSQLLDELHRWFSLYTYFDVPEFEGVTTNELYTALQLHLGSSPSVNSSSSSAPRRLTLSRTRNATATSFAISRNDRIADAYSGVTLWWEHRVADRSAAFTSGLPGEERRFVLRMRTKHRDQLLRPYLDHIMDRAAEVRRLSRDRLLYTNSRSGGGGGAARSQPWEAVPFRHPSTFDTLAIDPCRKADIVADLRAFIAGREFYKNTGRAWKRGYLLHGPPGTGKSSLIAAMANFLGYDVYDLELTEVRTNAELRRLLVTTTNKSIIVVEDIDCASLNLSDRAGNDNDGNPNSSITLSGLLNFTDGLWSCCGSERIFIFTTNHVDKLDPALLRCGRMDSHILMSFCTAPAFKILATNYLGVPHYQHHLLAKLVESRIEDARMTPAHVTELLLRNRRDTGAALQDLLHVITHRIKLRQQRLDRSTDEEEEELEALQSPHKNKRTTSFAPSTMEVCVRCGKVKDRKKTLPETEKAD